MKRYLFSILLLVLIFPAYLNAGWPTSYPLGLTVYKPEKAFPGFTILAPTRKNPMLIDKNGFFIRFWNMPINGPVKLLPDGHIMTFLSDQFVEYDQDGILVSSFKMPEGVTAHHDFHLYENGNILVA